MDKLSFTPLKRIAHSKGDILHALKRCEDDYNGFGEAYFSIINFKEIKGWKKHHEMVLNFVVPIGDVLFYVHDEDNNLTHQFSVGESNHGRLHIPAGYWVAFEGLTKGVNIILNIASIEHDPNESETVDIARFSLHA
ncbi:TPA: dTDP-4-dehydrorhamnose 3,5-epimerase [Shewanella algae]|uniref:dTDP-4-dehydrorhamnose 3,5-epimerase n=1 Tax=Shewanella algae TaxID=38313 RepID=UPI001C57A9BE|nr:dTDP-4-dehydrorhamnose 3,5-epimerase [Shewanella algae]HDS1207149.1 dTDP-4-dehydrorhamnose 3,5-epimerase [Shewanella algae]